jgi:4-amino-4-deoxy-L-arabinose transferase-like glycosyltransferase
VQSGLNNQGKDNVDGWRMVEFPLVNGLLAYLLRAFPSLDLVLVSRLASVVASLFSLYFLALIVRGVYGDRIALASAFFFAVLPYSIYYSRVILPEPFFIALSLASMFAYFKFLKTKDWRFVITSALLFALALLVKPMAIFFIPVFFGLRWRDGVALKAKDVASAIIFGLCFIPLLLWRRWILQFPLGIPFSNWLYNGGEGQNLSPIYMIRFKPAWFRWLFYERLTKLFLGFFGLFAFVAGFLNPKRIVLISFAIGALLYISVFAAGNVQHDYYQAPLVPFVSLAMGIGICTIYDFLRSKIKPLFALLTCIVIVGLTQIFAMKYVMGYYNINNPAIIEAGKAADELLPVEAKVIAPYGGDTAFLFATNRTGWPIGQMIEQKIEEGAKYYVSVNYDDEANMLMKKYSAVKLNKDFLILDLTKPIKK